MANHSNSALPLGYRLSAIWGGHEGSLLLWGWLLSAWAAMVGWLSRSVPLEMVARVLAVMGMIAVGFLLFMLLTSNPFDRTLPWFPLDGADLNPLLQDPGLIVHPPMLYMGYGFSVAFAFAVAGLGDNLDRPGRSVALDHRGLVLPDGGMRWAPGGPTTNSVGVAGGSGIRWKMPR